MVAAPSRPWCAEPAELGRTERRPDGLSGPPTPACRGWARRCRSRLRRCPAPPCPWGFRRPPGTFAFCSAAAAGIPAAPPGSAVSARRGGRLAGRQRRRHPRSATGPGAERRAAEGRSGRTAAVEAHWSGGYIGPRLHAQRRVRGQGRKDGPWQCVWKEPLIRGKEIVEGVKKKKKNSKQRCRGVAAASWGCRALSTGGARRRDCPGAPAQVRAGWAAAVGVEERSDGFTRTAVVPLDVGNPEGLSGSSEWQRKA